MPKGNIDPAPNTTSSGTSPSGESSAPAATRANGCMGSKDTVSASRSALSESSLSSLSSSLCCPRCRYANRKVALGCTVSCTEAEKDEEENVDAVTSALSGVSYAQLLLRSALQEHTARATIKPSNFGSSCKLAKTSTHTACISRERRRSRRDDTTTAARTAATACIAQRRT